MAIQVKCIKKADRDNPWERIVCIGGTNANGSRWKLTQAAAIEGIETGKYKFYVGETLLGQVKVVVAVSQYGHKYIKTEADGEDQNNLLSLLECP